MFYYKNFKEKNNFKFNGYSFNTNLKKLFVLLFYNSGTVNKFFNLY